MTAVEERQADQADSREQDRAGRNGRTAERTVKREYRPRRTVPAVIVALLLAVGSILGAIEVISYLVDAPAGVFPAGWLAELGRENAWNDPLTIIVAIVLAVLGLLLLVLALWPGKARAVAVASDRPGVTMAMGPHDLERLAVRAAEDVDGIDSANAQVGRGRVSVRADSPLHDAGDLSDQVQRAVEEMLGQVVPVREHRVRVHVRHRED